LKQASERIKEVQEGVKETLGTIKQFGSDAIRTTTGSINNNSNNNSNKGARGSPVNSNKQRKKVS